MSHKGLRGLISLLLVFISFAGLSQNRLSDRIFFGGGGGLSASSNQTNISVFPQVGYRVFDNYIAGVGVIYQYVRLGSPINESLSNYGWSLFNRYNITRQFFAYGEFERLTFQYFVPNTGFELKERSGYNSLLLGGGFTNQISGNAAFSTSILYNVLYDSSDPTQPYNSPWVVRAGIGVGLF